MNRNPEKYSGLVSEIAALIETGRRQATRSVNAVITATYWEIGRRIVEYEQKGDVRAEYGQALLKRLSKDLSRNFVRGFSVNNLEAMRLFYQYYPSPHISATVSRKLHPDKISQTVSGKLGLSLPGQPNGPKMPSRRPLSLNELSAAFPLSWSHYVLLLYRARSPESRQFYETEALRGGWSVRQLERQIDSQFYERVALSRNKVAMLKKGETSRSGDRVSPEEAMKDPYVLEFLNLKDEYSESDLEEAIIRHLEAFLLELGSDFTFVSRQKRLRIGDEWYRVDLVFYHRRLRCLVLIDVKLDKFTHAAAGQMHLYLNYAKEQWTHPDENPPVGLILCAKKDAAVAHYALTGLANKILAAEYRTILPAEKLLAREVNRTRRLLQHPESPRRYGG